MPSNAAQASTDCCPLFVLCSAEAGHVTSERIARLCGDHLEHCYEAQRLTTHGTTCVSVAFHTETPTAAGQQAPAQPSWGPACARTGPKQLLVCATSTNSIAVFDAATSTCIEQHTKGSKRCSSAFTPSLSHVAVYGDPMAPAIELQLCNLGKYAWLEGHTGTTDTASLGHSGPHILLLQLIHAAGTCSMPGPDSSSIAANSSCLCAPSSSG